MFTLVFTVMLLIFFACALVTKCESKTRRNKNDSNEIKNLLYILIKIVY